MPLRVQALHSGFAAEVQAMDLSQPLDCSAIGKVQAAIDTYPVLVFRDQRLSDTQLRELCQRVELGATVLEQWRFTEKLSLGQGISALFAGPSGTGKTMAAEVVAHQLGIDLIRDVLAHELDVTIAKSDQESFGMGARWP